jgi:hypothetical protein
VVSRQEGEEAQSSKLKVQKKLQASGSRIANRATVSPHNGHLAEMRELFHTHQSPLVFQDWSFF